MKRFILCLFLALSSLSYSFLPATDSKVWVCVGGSAYAYHAKKDCRGLARCTHTIKEVSESDAKTTYKRKPCKECY